MIDAERAVVAAILLDSRVMRAVADVLDPQDFEDARLGDIFEHMRDRHRTGKPVDVVVVAGLLPEWGIRGIEPADLHSWISDVPASVHAPSYALQVREDALRRGIRMVATRLAHDVDGLDPGLTIARGLTGLEGLRNDTRTEGFHARPVAALLADDVPDYDWVIPGLLERRDRLLITGGEGGGKTTLLRQFAVLAGAGLHPFTFFGIEPLRVLVVDAENSETQWRRNLRPLITKAQQRGSADPGQNFHLVCTARLDLTNASDLGGVHRVVDGFRPSVLIIGPLYRLSRGAINSDDDAAPLLAALDTLRDRGLALIIEAHAGHSLGMGGERELRPRGSSALLGWPEFGLGLRQDREDANGYTLVKWRGDRDGRDWPRRLRRGGEWPWTPTVFSSQR